MALRHRAGGQAVCHSADSVADLPRHFSYGEDTLNAALGVFNQPVIFPVQGAPDGLFDHPWKVGHMYNATVDVQLQGQVDAILFLPNVSAMQATEAQR